MVSFCDIINWWNEKGILVIELTRYQHLDIIRALAESSGGRFKMLNNTLPAYRKKEGDWVKMMFPRDIDAFLVERDIGMPIHRLPTVDDRLGGIAKIKDKRRATSVLHDVLDGTDVGSLEPVQAARFIKKSLVDKGARMPLSTFNAALVSALTDNMRASPDNVLDRLDLVGQQIYWPEHHIRTLPFEPREGVAETPPYGSLSHDASLVKKVLVDAARNHYMRPDLFVMDVFSALLKRNLAPSVSDTPAVIDMITPEVARFLKDTLTLYAQKGEGALDAAAAMIKLRYLPLGHDTQTIGRKRGLSMLRQALSESPVAILDSPPASTDKRFNERLLLIENLSLRNTLWQWRGALNGLIEDNQDTLPVEKLNEKWRIVMTQDVTVFTPVDELKLLIGRVEKIYGKLLKGASEKINAKLGVELKSALIAAPALKTVIESAVQHLQKSQSGNALSSYNTARSLSEVFSSVELEKMKQEYQSQGVLPAVESLLSDLECKAINDRSFVQEPLASRGMKR
jgi:hypothetical protein